MQAHLSIANAHTFDLLQASERHQRAVVGDAHSAREVACQGGEAGRERGKHGRDGQGMLAHLGWQAQWQHLHVKGHDGHEVRESAQRIRYELNPKL